jgi:excisionase family DNA binding protein
VIKTQSLAAPVVPVLGRSVSIEQAARALDVSRRTIYNRIREGRLQTIRTLGGSQRVLIESLHVEGLALAARPMAAGQSPASRSGRRTNTNRPQATGMTAVSARP